MLRAAPKKRFGLCSACASTPPDRILRPVVDQLAGAQSRSDHQDDHAESDDGEEQGSANRGAPDGADSPLLEPRS
jgi:hypothetical protein